MTALLMALALSLAPEPPLSPADDFNEMVEKHEVAFRCDAVRVYKIVPDVVRIVEFRCENFDALVIFQVSEDGDWLVVQRAWKAPRAPAVRGKAEDI